MMRAMRLLLMRHAKAVAGEGLPDHDRPLTAQGELDAARMGRWLRETSAEPDAVWCSSALRARQTWANVAAELTEPPEPSYHRSVYLAGPAQLLDVVREIPPAVGSALIIGHNPTMQQLLRELTGDDRSFPAGAVALVDVAGPWSSPGTARLRSLVGPNQEGT